LLIQRMTTGLPPQWVGSLGRNCHLFLSEYHPRLIIRVGRGCVFVVLSACYCITSSTSQIYINTPGTYSRRVEYVNCMVRYIVTKHSDFN